MPGIEAYRPNEAIKSLIMGNPGAGKTCALAALANAGFKLRILDFDNKLTAMRSYLHPDAYKNVYFYTLTDKLKTLDNMVVPQGSPVSTMKAMKLLNHWKTQTEDLGKLYDWKNDTVLVLDSLTFQGNSAMRYVQALHGRSGMQPFPGDWGEAQTIQEGLLALLFGEAVQCNVVIISHITYLGGAQEGTTGLEGADAEKNKFNKAARDYIRPGAPITAYPSALGRKLPPIVGQYFDSILFVDTRTVGGKLRPTLITEALPYMPLKNPAPHLVPKEIPLEINKEGHAENGLAKYFKIVLNAYATGEVKKEDAA